MVGNNNEGALFRDNIELGSYNIGFDVNYDEEVTHYKGQGRLVLTGKLGDVMKESAQAALSYVKSNYEKYGIDYKLFNENDVHIHVPEGAIPKDGPSAGVTITTGIISSFTNRPVDHTVGMTGEITLRGKVLPIGGLREKSIAAHRSGLQTILIPVDNIKDLEMIMKAYDYADFLHDGQVRLSGEKYIIHPLSVALILSEMHADTDTICASLLHDTIEDTNCTKEDIINLFNKDIVYLTTFSIAGTL